MHAPVSVSVRQVQAKTLGRASEPRAPDEPVFGVAIGKGEAQRPVADGAEELVDDVVQQDVAHVLRAHAARLRAGCPSLG